LVSALSCSNESTTPAAVAERRSDDADATKQRAHGEGEHEGHDAGDATAQPRGVDLQSCEEQQEWNSRNDSPTTDRTRTGSSTRTNPRTSGPTSTPNTICTTTPGTGSRTRRTGSGESSAGAPTRAAEVKEIICRSRCRVQGVLDHDDADVQGQHQRSAQTSGGTEGHDTSGPTTDAGPAVIPAVASRPDAGRSVCDDPF
jgi:hypothetical protein